MRRFRATYRDKEGKERQSLKWYLDFRDHLGIRHRIPAYTDKQKAKPSAATSRSWWTCEPVGKPWTVAFTNG